MEEEREREREREREEEVPSLQKYSLQLASVQSLVVFPGKEFPIPDNKCIKCAIQPAAIAIPAQL